MAHPPARLRPELAFSLLTLLTVACGGGQSFDDGSDKLGTKSDHEETDAPALPSPGGEAPIPPTDPVPTDPMTPTDPALDLAGLEFLLDSSEGFTPLPNTSVRLWFEEAVFGFSAGCNGHSGSYTLCGDALCSEGMGSTDIGCDEERHAQDNFLATFFTSTPSVSLRADYLTLSSDTATLEFLNSEVANPDRPLTGRVWIIDTFITGQSASNFPLQVEPTLEFFDDGTFVTFTTCIEANGTFTSTDQTLDLAGLSYDEPACPPTGSDTADARIKEVLSPGTVQYEIDEQRLTLTRGDVGLSAMTE